MVLPISPISRKKLVVKLREIICRKDEKSVRKVIDALIKGALNSVQFPHPHFKKLDLLQQTYLAFESNEKIARLQQESIAVYIAEEGITLLREILSDPHTIATCPATFLGFLVDEFKIQIEPEPLVQVAIESGKIYWKIVKEGKDLYCRPGFQSFDFAATSTCLMTWEQFRQFKDAGKRSSTVKINKERFISRFSEIKREQAEAVWAELKQQGILNSRNRLSRAWYAVSNIKIFLQSVSDPDGIISKDEIKNCLREIGRDNKLRPVRREEFVEYWSKPFKSRAGAIWDYLKQTGCFDKNERVISFTFRFEPPDIDITYPEIMQALKSIVQNPENGEVIPVESSTFKIYRPERTQKLWHGTAKVDNDDPTGKVAKIQKWDVVVYNEASLHLNNEGTTKNSRLNCDHIPAFAACKVMSENMIAQYDTQLEELSALLGDILKRILIREGQIRVEQGIIHATRKHDTDAYFKEDPELCLLQKQKADVDCKVQETQLTISHLHAEKSGHGPYGWVIAIPETLHRRGETFLVSASRQKQSAEELFLRDIRCYLDILMKCPEEFEVGLDEYIKVLGALRYLYHCQVTQAEKIGGIYTASLSAIGFFNDKKSRKEIDTLLMKSLSEHIIKL